jgi:ParB family chromosome partitioning protein
MKTCWHDTTVLPDLLRDKQVLNAVLAEVAGPDVAEANAEATAKVQRGILVDCLTGSNGRAKLEGWVPRWFAFPPSGYTERGGVGCVERSERIAPLVASVGIDAEPEMREAA